jgi:hypothetical protein
MMKDAQQPPQEQFRIGLIFRVGSRSWFWGRGAAPAVRRAEQTITPTQTSSCPAERWPGLAGWLRQMHAADRPALDAAFADGSEPQTAQDIRPDAPAPHSGSTRRIRLVCNRRVIGLLIN